MPSEGPWDTSPALALTLILISRLTPSEDADTLSLQIFCSAFTMPLTDRSFNTAFYVPAGEEQCIHMCAWNCILS